MLRSFHLSEPGDVWLADELGSLGGTFTVAWDINNDGDIVGTALTAEGLRHPFIYTSSSGMTDLNTLIDPQQLCAGPHGPDELTWANAISDAGQIVAGGWNWYLLTPIPEVLPGDFNSDGTVNAADYVVWRDHLGAPAGTLPNDVDSGVIGTAQYDTWKANYGLTAGSGALTNATVPEPGTMVLLILAATGCLFSARLSHASAEK